MGTPAHYQDRSRSQGFKHRCECDMDIFFSPETPTAEGSVGKHNSTRADEEREC